MSVLTVAAVIVGAASLSFGIYSSVNAPQTPQQASQAINREQLSLVALNKQRATNAAKGQDTSALDAKISTAQQNIVFLNSWIQNYGNTVAPNKADKSYAAIANLGNAGAIVPSSGGIASLGSSFTGAIKSAPKWTILVGGAGIILVIGGTMYLMKKTK